MLEQCRLVSLQQNAYIEEMGERVVKKCICIMLILVILAYLFVGCTGHKDPTGFATISTESTQASEPDPSTTEAPTEAPTEVHEVSASDIIASLAPRVLFNSTFNCKEYIFRNVSSKDTILSRFMDEGFHVLDIDPIDGAKYETIILNKSEELVTAYWFESEGEMRLLCESTSEKEMACLQPNEETGSGAITVVQIGIERLTETDNPLIGMCYIVKLSNGKAIIIDGGFDNRACIDNLYNSFEKLGVAKDAEGDYLIEAWIFSHGHNDHTGILSGFALKYRDRVKVEYFLYNMPSGSDASRNQGRERVFHTQCRNNFPDAVHVIPRSGVKYYFGNVVIDMLYTPDLVWSPSEKITYYNNTSLVFKLNGGGASLFSYGDAGEAASKEMWNRYDSSVFKSDILQITHHGLYTGSGADEHSWHYLKRVYDATQATYAVLPMHARYKTGTERNGRYTVLVYWSKCGYQASYVVNRSDNHGLASFDQSYYDAFCDSVRDGTNTKTTLFGYDGINKIINEDGMITFLGSNEYAPMVTAFSFVNGEVTVTLNDALYSWFEAT